MRLIVYTPANRMNKIYPFMYKVQSFSLLVKQWMFRWYGTGKFIFREIVFANKYFVILSSDLQDCYMITRNRFAVNKLRFSSYAFTLFSFLLTQVLSGRQVKNAQFHFTPVFSTSELIKIPQHVFR